MLRALSIRRMERVRQLISLLFSREQLGEDAPIEPPRTRPDGLSLVFKRETLGEDPPPAPPAEKGLGGILATVFRFEALPLDPAPEEPAKKSSPLRPVSLVLGIESLPKDPEAAAPPERPFLKWLLWPETIPAEDTETTKPGGH